MMLVIIGAVRAVRTCPPSTGARGPGTGLRARNAGRPTTAAGPDPGRRRPTAGHRCRPERPTQAIPASRSPGGRSPARQHGDLRTATGDDVHQRRLPQAGRAPSATGRAGPPAGPPRRPPGGRWRALVALTKPRIIELLLVTTVPTMLLAQRGLPSLQLVLVTLVGGTLAAGSANTINCYIDRDIDAVMKRTSRRPLVVNGRARSSRGRRWPGASCSAPAPRCCSA